MLVPGATGRSSDSRIVLGSRPSRLTNSLILEAQIRKTVGCPYPMEQARSLDWPDIASVVTDYSGGTAVDFHHTSLPKTSLGSYRAAI